MQLDQERVRLRLKSFVAQQRMTHRQFAEHIGMNRVSTSRVLAGSQRISEEFIGRFSLVYGFQAADEVFGPQPAQPIPADGLSNADAAG